MSFWQRPANTESDEPSRAEIILAKKPPREAAGARSLIQVVIPRETARQTHQRNEDRCVVDGLTARQAVGTTQVEIPVYNLSSNGLMVTSAPPLTIGAQVEIAIGGCDPVPMAVCWLRDDRVGFEFRTETAIVSESGLQDLIMDAIIRQHGHSAYTPPPVVGRERRTDSTRHALMWLCTMYAGDGGAVGRIRNISRTGAMIALSEGVNLARGGEVVMALEKAGEFRGTVRWCTGQDIGIELKEEFPLALLANEPCVEVLETEAHAPASYTSREEALRIRYTGLSNPTSPPKMDYQPLTLQELYRTLYDGYDTSRLD